MREKRFHPDFAQKRRGKVLAKRTGRGYIQPAPPGYYPGESVTAKRESPRRAFFRGRNVPVNLVNG